MASIHKRRNKYQVRVRRKGYPTISRTFLKLSDAKESATLQERQADRGELGPNRKELERIILADDDLHFHDLRHEAISRLSELGLTAPEVASISGHGDMTMLFRYAHANHVNIRTKLATVDQPKAENQLFTAPAELLAIAPSDSAQKRMRLGSQVSDLSPFLLLICIVVRTFWRPLAKLHSMAASDLRRPKGPAVCY